MVCEKEKIICFAKETNNSGTSQRFGVCVAKPDGMWEFAANRVHKIGISHLAFYPVLEIELAEQMKESQVKCGIIQ